MALSLLLLLTLATTAAGLLHQRRTARELAVLRLSMRRVAAAMLEGARAEAQIDNLRQLQRAAERGVELGTSTVRSVHKGIASIPFGILEAIPATRHPTRIVRSLHDQISDVVYDSISGGNKLVGSALRLGLKQQAKGRDQSLSGSEPKSGEES